MLILILFAQHFSPLALAIIGIITVILFLFHSLIVEVSNNVVRIKYGPGFVQKKIKIKDIESCAPVHNEPRFSFGLVRFGPGFILYNVSGRQAIELEVRGKKRKIRVGTDEPEQVCEAIREARQQA